MTPFIIIERHRHCSSNKEPKTGFENITKHVTNVLKPTDGYSRYIEKHGHHFTDELAEYASKMMKNANSQNHSWTAIQVQKSMDNLGLCIPSNVTTGDVTYLANMYYADLYPDPLKDEAACLKAAYRSVNDPDGYESMTFCRWIADAIGKAIKIDWEKFI